MFFKKLMKQVNRVTADVYAYIFLCDFINFFVLLFGFAAFGVCEESFLDNFLLYFNPITIVYRHPKETVASLRMWKKTKFQSIFWL